jgi:magnesium transporter
MTSPADAAVDALASEMLAAFPVEAARALERASADDVAALLAQVDADIAVPVVRALSPPVARDSLVAMPVEAAARIAAGLPAPWVAALFRAAPRERVDAVLAALPARQRAAVTTAMQHRPKTAAALAEAVVLSLASDVDAAFALDQVRGRSVTARDGVYVVDREGRLAGVVGVADLVVAAPDAKLASLMTTDVVALGDGDDAGAIVANPGWHSWRTLPVVDGERMLLGVVRYETVQRLLLDHPAHEPSGVGLPVSLAELFWVGLIGMTDGLARTVAPPRRTDDS